jgi:FHA domain-containing protein/TIR domain-containing protein
VPKLFVSYARNNKRAIDELVADLAILGYETWVDSSLRGGQDWWEVILRQIAACDGFVAIVSRDALSSEACRREFDWAEALEKPVLPVAVEPAPKALPGRFSRRQIVDYSEPGQRAALKLAGGLTALPTAPPLPEPLPLPPRAPLSYLTELIDVVSAPELLTEEGQREIVHQLETALRSIDPDERQGARDILDRFRCRDDLDSDVGQLATQLTEVQVLQPDRSSPGFAAVAATLTEPETKADCARLHGADGQIVVIAADGLRIGRMPDNDLVVSDPKASRHHAVIATTQDGFILRDLGSSNGSFVGDTKVLESHLLSAGDEIRIGEQSWTFEPLDPSEG